ncbi:MAG: VWA domain-containing protein [Anaerolineae bacterium]
MTDPAARRPLSVPPSQAPNRRSAPRRTLAAGLAGAVLLIAAVRTLTAAEGRLPAVVDQSGPSEAYRLAATWPGGNLQGPADTMLAPAGIDATAEALYVADSGNDRIDVLGFDGKLLATIGGPGSGPGQLSEPRDVAVVSGMVHVADRGNARIVHFASDGKAQGEWPLPEGLLPWGLAAGGGKVYISVPERGLILVLANGREEARWAVEGEPRGLDLGPDGSLYVAEPRGRAVLQLDAAGKVIKRFPQAKPEYAPLDLSVDDNGDLYIQSAGAILWFKSGETDSQQALFMEGMMGVAHWPRKGVFATIASTARVWHGVIGFGWQPRNGDAIAVWPRLGFPEGRLKAPHAIHAAVDGRIWVLDAWPRLQAFQPDGSLSLHVVPQFTPSRPFQPVDLTVSPAGEPLVVEPRWLHRLSMLGQPLQSLRLRSGVTEQWATAIQLRDQGRRVTVLDSAAPALRHYGITQTLRALDSELLTQTFSQTWSLWWDIAAADEAPDGKLYAAHRGRSRVDVLAKGLPVGGWDTSARPRRLAVGPDGAVFVLGIDGVVSKYRPDGGLLAAWDAGAFSPAGSDVADLTVDPDGRVYTVDRAANKVQVWTLDPGATPEPIKERRGGCRLAGDKQAMPASLALGEQVEVTLQIGGSCPDAGQGVDIVLAIDRSFSMMENNKITDTIAAALAFADQVDMSRDRLGLVTFNNSAALAQGLTADRAAVKRAISSISPAGGTNIAAALETATAELLGPRARVTARPVLILLTDGKDDQPDAVLRMAEVAKVAGIRLFTIGFGAVDPMVMVRSASSPEDSFYAPDATALGGIYAEIAKRLTATVLARSLSITDELPADMRFVGPSSGPTPRVAGNTLSWTFTDLPFDGMTMAYRVQPQQIGRRPTNVRAWAEFVDGLAQLGDLTFPVPMVEVLSQPPTPTRTPSPRPTATPSATPTATPRPAEPIFLPLVVFQRCQDKTVFADVMLAIDTSGSMAQPAADGQRTRLQVAAEAATQFVTLLLTERGNQAGVVTFDSDARVLAPLTGDAAQLQNILAGLQSVQGTRIDRGLQEAAAELAGPRAQPGSNRVIVLLTDGRVDIDPQLVVGAADAAKAVGITVVAVGLGSDTDVDFDLLGRIASRPENVFRAPTTSELRLIYSQIAYTIRCPNLDWP